MTSITNLKLNNNAVQNEVSENKKVEIIEQDDAVPAQAVVARRQLYVRRQPGLSRLRGYRRGDNRRAVPVARVVLDDEHRPHAALLAAHYGAEVGVVDVSALYWIWHWLHTPYTARSHYM